MSKSNFATDGAPYRYTLLLRHTCTSQHYVFSEYKLNKSLCCWTILRRQFACKGEGPDISVVLAKSNRYKFVCTNKIAYEDSSVVLITSWAWVVSLRFLANYPACVPVETCFDKTRYFISLNLLKSIRLT